MDAIIYDIEDDSDPPMVSGDAVFGSVMDAIIYDIEDDSDPPMVSGDAVFDFTCKTALDKAACLEYNTVRRGCFLSPDFDPQGGIRCRT
jgi:hypothetical protein